MRLLASLIARDWPDAAPIHRHLARAYRLNDTGAELIRRVLPIMQNAQVDK